MSTVREFEWNCSDQGCFNQKKRLRFSAFKPALNRAGIPAAISFSDIDGFFERKGFFFFVEWKEVGVPLGMGQKIAFKRLTAISEKIVVLAVEGDAETMTCDAWSAFYRGMEHPTEYGDMDDFLDLIEDWANIAEAGTFNPEVLARRAERKISGH